MKTPDQIVSAWVERRKSMQKVHAIGETLRRVYNGEQPVPLPELERNERASIANLLQSGVDQHAMRIASVVPNIIVPPVKPNKLGLKRADERRLALQAWWYENQLNRKLRRRARHLVGYSMSPVLIRPGSDGIPRWEVRDPLRAYPAPGDPDDLVPSDCIFGFKRAWGWVRNHYAVSGSFIGPKVTDDTPITLLEYLDADQHTLLMVGQESETGGGLNKYVLANTPNRAGVPLVVCPGRITLDRLQGQFDQLVGMYDAQAQLWALQMHAVKRAVFAETWITDAPNEHAEMEVQADPYDGTVGIVHGGQITHSRVEAGQTVNQALDRLERNERITGAIPAEMGGESPSNVRTDRRGQTVFSATVDFPVQEHQELLAASLEAENRIAIKIAKTYWPDTPRTFQVPFGRGQVTYTPSQTFETETQRVSYSFAGADVNGLVISGGQRIGMGTLSKRTFMMNDPMVSDWQAEHDFLVGEGLEMAHMQSIQAQAANPDAGYPPGYLSRLTELVVEQGLPLYLAEQQAQAEMQAQQAQAQQGQLPPEQMQPGNAPPGAPGTPGGGTPIGPPPASSANLVQLLTSLRRPQTGKFANAQ